jgi:hypothetical protein
MNCPACQGYVVVPLEVGAGAWVDVERSQGPRDFGPQRGAPSAGLIAAVGGIITLLVLVVLAGALTSRGPRSANEVGKMAQPVAPQAVAVNPPAEPVAVKLTVKRRTEATDEDLRLALAQMPEVALNSPQEPNTAKAIAARAEQQARVHGRVVVGDTSEPLLNVVLAPDRPDLKGLPLQMGEKCQTGREPAQEMNSLSPLMRQSLADAYGRGGPMGGACPGGQRQPDSARLRDQLANNPRWLRPEAVPTLVQMLMAEDKQIRLVLVELLTRIEDRRSTEALAQRALFDLAPEVRQAAIFALKGRPHETYQEVLLEGFHYPWAPAADHAAEALVELKLRHLVPRLVRFLDEPAPGAPFKKAVGKQEVSVVREVVKVSHLGNCMLCHAPSLAHNDLIRSSVPDPDRPLPESPSPQGYGGPQGPFVRADVTYLRQDFSVVQPVANPRQWPSQQRFDYLVRERALSVEELAALEARKDKPAAPSKHKEAVLFALRELTGKDLGPDAAAWKRLALRPAQRDRLLW